VSVSEGETDGEQMARRCVVIIDDDDAIVETLEDVLQAEGYDVRGYTDPVHALEQLRAQQMPPDIIVLDCVMPAMDGPRVMEVLQAEGSTVPIVLVTALSDPGFCINPSHPMAARIINKPFDLEQLLDTLNDIVHARRKGAGAVAAHG
jgi:DNA-binding response OmpR family regulator